MLVLNDDQVMLQDAARGFVSEKAPVAALRKIRDEKIADGFDRGLWRSMAEMGWTGVLVPEDQGGLGFGFFMLHNGIQVKMLELAPQARGSSVAMHAFFLFTGQALGPVLYGQALPVWGSFVTTLVSGAVMLATGLACARLLQGPSTPGGARPA